MRISVCITTYERPEYLRHLLLDLERERAADVRVYDDCSQSDYATANAVVDRNGWRRHRSSVNHGKEGYSRLIEDIWLDLRASPSDFYVFLQDDNRLCSRFFERLRKTWSRIDSSSKATLMLMTDSRDVIWGATRQPTRLGRAAKAERIDWVDMIHAAPSRTLRDFDFKFPGVSMPPCATGSGAGRGLTLALRQLGRKMYRANPSLVAHVGMSSQMHAEERKKHPLIVRNFVDGEERHSQLMRGER